MKHSVLTYSLITGVLLAAPSWAAPEAVPATEAAPATEATPAPAATQKTKAQLKAEGYDVKRSAQSYPFAALHGVKIEGGLATGGADPQRDGMAISVPG